MILKNYTSDVPSSTTINRIQNFLIKAGVSQLSMDYGLTGEIVALTFSIQIEANKRPVSIRLPANVEGAHEALWQDRINGKSANLSKDGQRACFSNGVVTTRDSLRAQAERTAWRLVQDWIEVQLSMVALKQADFMQVFLPYAWDGKQSFYAKIKGHGFLELQAPQEDNV